MIKGPPEPGTADWSELLEHIAVASHLNNELWSESDAAESEDWLVRRYLHVLTPDWARESYGDELADAEFNRIVSDRAEYIEGHAKAKFRMVDKSVSYAAPCPVRICVATPRVPTKSPTVELLSRNECRQ